MEGRASSYKIPSHLLDDLCSRFILNIPDEYKDDIIRTFFQIELAHWFYIDFFVPEIHGLKVVGIKEFVNQVFVHCPFLLSGADNVDTAHKDWKAYKLAVPTYGVILMDPTLSYVLLVQGFSKSWGFPKGKVNESEEPVKCAIRELLEETGCDASSLIDESNYLEHTAGDQYARLYIVPGVPLNTRFLPQTRNEIRGMQWFPLTHLPSHKKDVSHSEELKCGPNSFFMVIPFVKPLRRWISRNGQAYASSASPQRSEQVSQAQNAFTKKSLTQFEEMLALESTSPASRSPDRPTSNRKSRRSRASTPQYTILQKDSKEESLKKLQERKMTLDPDPLDDVGKLPDVEAERAPFKPVKEWRNFRLDIHAIMQAATNIN